MPPHCLPQRHGRLNSGATYRIFPQLVPSHKRSNTDCHEHCRSHNLISSHTSNSRRSPVHRQQGHRLQRSIHIPQYLGVTEARRHTTTRRRTAAYRRTWLKPLRLHNSPLSIKGDPSLAREAQGGNLPLYQTLSFVSMSVSGSGTLILTGRAGGTELAVRST